MKEMLVGNTGFVGSNILGKHSFDLCFNSSNIGEAYGKNPDVLVYAGVLAQKFIANKFPEKDMQHISDTIENIKRINPKMIILISSIDVYTNPINVDEDSVQCLEEIQPYGKNRLYLEKWVENNFDKYFIVRLPALFGNNIKKNFIFDMINIIPSMLNEAKFKELVNKNNDLNNYYKKQENGFYVCNELDDSQKRVLKDIFLKLEFTALNFTDSRSKYQFLNLSNLWGIIDKACKLKIKKLNISSEPISAAEIYKYVNGKELTNIISENPVNYDFKSKYANKFGGENGYIISKDTCLQEIKQFVLDRGDNYVKTCN